MHSFRHSRARILFEVVCVLAISGSCAGAWMQTGAWALLPASFVTLVYGVIHLFDMAGPRIAATIEPQRIDFGTDHQVGSLADLDDGASLSVVDQHSEPDSPIEEAAPVELNTGRASKGRKTKSPRKASARKTSAVVETKVSGAERPEEADLPMAVVHEEAAHHSLAPLFEPEPFARQRHAVFGRKAG
jgi:hypothetical protein